MFPFTRDPHLFLTLYTSPSNEKGGTFPDKQLHLRLSYEVGLPRPLPFTRYHLGMLFSNNLTFGGFPYF